MRAPHEGAEVAEAEVAVRLREHGLVEPALEGVPGVDRDPGDAQRCEAPEGRLARVGATLAHPPGHAAPEARVRGPGPGRVRRSRPGAGGFGGPRPPADFGQSEARRGPHLRRGSVHGGLLERVEGRRAADLDERQRRLERRALVRLGERLDEGRLRLGPAGLGQGAEQPGPERRVVPGPARRAAAAQRRRRRDRPGTPPRAGPLARRAGAPRSGVPTAPTAGRSRRRAVAARPRGSARAPVAGRRPAGGRGARPARPRGPASPSTRGGSLRNDDTLAPPMPSRPAPGPRVPDVPLVPREPRRGRPAAAAHRGAAVALPGGTTP